jgi:hypothetical protein
MLVSVFTIFTNIFVVKVSSKGITDSEFVRKLLGENVRQGSVHYV